MKDILVHRLNTINNYINEIKSNQYLMNLDVFNKRINKLKSLHMEIMRIIDIADFKFIMYQIDKLEYYINEYFPNIKIVY